MDSTQQTIVRTIATQEANTLAKVQAQNVLHLVYRDTFPVYVDEEEQYLRQQQTYGNLTPSKSNSAMMRLTLVPNPANDFVIIKVEGTKSKKFKLEIIDITGKQIKFSEVDFTNGDINLNVEYLNSGLYLVRAFDGTKINLSSKLMITR